MHLDPPIIARSIPSIFFGLPFWVAGEIDEPGEETLKRNSALRDRSGGITNASPISPSVIPPSPINC